MSEEFCFLAFAILLPPKTLQLLAVTWGEKTIQFFWTSLQPKQPFAFGQSGITHPGAACAAGGDLHANDEKLTAKLRHARQVYCSISTGTFKSVADLACFFM
jgi:hypothetical protein